MKLLLHIFLFASVCAAAAENTPPVIKKFVVAKQLQGEQGVEQVVLRGVAHDAEDGPKVDYRYRIVSGGGRLEPIRRYAVYHPDRAGVVLFELTVTDSAGATAELWFGSAAGAEISLLRMSSTTWPSANASVAATRTN